MQKINPKQILLKQPSKYDIPGFINQEKRKYILQRALWFKPKLSIKGGNSLTNPYKHIQEIILAERRELYHQYEKSILWSPKYTPWHFKNLFLYPFLCVGFLMWYIRYIAMPKKMVRMKQKGYDFPNLEAKGYLEGWIEEDEEAFLEPVESQEGNYLEWTAKNLSEIEYKKKKLDNMNKEKNQIIKNKMQNQLQDIYTKKQNQAV